MRFRNPGGDLVWLTPLLILGGFFLAWSSFRVGSSSVAILYGSVAFFSLLVWFDLRWVAIPLMIYFLLAIFGGILILFTKGFSWRLLWQLVLAGYAVNGFREWRKRPDF